MRPVPPPPAPDRVTRRIVLDLPEDLAAWLDAQTGGDAAARTALPIEAVDKLRPAGPGGAAGGNDPPPRSGSCEAFQAWLGDTGDRDDDAAMREVVREIYRDRGYPMEHFVFGPDAPGDAADVADDDAVKKAA